MRALALIALLVALACGHYAPPERAAESKQVAPVSAPPAQGDAADEQCEEQAP